MKFIIRLLLLFVFLSPKHYQAQAAWCRHLIAAPVFFPSSFRRSRPSSRRYDLSRRGGERRQLLVHYFSSTTTTGGGSGSGSSSSSSSSGNNNNNHWKELKQKDRSLLHNVYHPRKLKKLLKKQQQQQQQLQTNKEEASHDDDDDDDAVADYIIIGSGIGGLWLGACLAKFNISSIILEQHYIAGGFQHTFWKGKYEFVPGLHYIANLDLCSPLYEMVATSSTSTNNTTTTTNNNNVIAYHQAGNSVSADEGSMVSHELKIGDLPLLQVRQGIDNVRNELIRVFPNETDAIDQFLNLMEKAKWQAGQFATFKIFEPPILQYVMSQLLCSTYIRYASQTTEEVLNKLTNDGRLKTVLSAFGGDLGESIGEGSFVMQAAVLGHVLEGCYYPRGGPIQFVRGLIPSIRQAGGDVFVKARVEQILVDNDNDNDNHNSGKGGKVKVRRVQLTNGDILTSRLGVVSDCGFRSTLKLLPTKEREKRSLRKLQDAVEKSSGVLVMFLPLLD